jgi:hypothetical protein
MSPYPNALNPNNFREGNLLEKCIKDNPKKAAADQATALLKINKK